MNVIAEREQIYGMENLINWRFTIKKNIGVMMNMEFVYKRAGLEDIELLVKTRIEVLCATVWGIAATAGCLSGVKHQYIMKVHY